MCKGFRHFSGFLHHSVLAKLATSSISVNIVMRTLCTPKISQMANLYAVFEVLRVQEYSFSIFDP